MPTSADHPTADLDRLRDRTIVVSGATGAVGGAVLERLVEHGARIAIAARKDWQVSRLREQLAGAPTLVAHVGTHDTEAAAGFVKGATDALGPIDALVSCAGAFAMAPVGRDPGRQASELFDANFFAAHTLTRAVVSALRRRRTGNLVFTGAAAVGSATRGMALYLASKAALHEYARTLAAEVRDDGVGVHVIAPGIVDTEANRDAMPDADRSAWVSRERLADALLAAAVADSPNDGDPVRTLTVGS